MYKRKLSSRKLNILFLIAIYNLSSCTNKDTTWQLASPDKKAVIEISLSKDKKQLSYTIIYDGKKLINPSLLGIFTMDSQFETGLKFIEAKEIRTVEEKYNLVAGNRKSCRVTSRELRLTFENNEKKPFDLIFRAYDNGAAFRYVLNNPEGKQVTVLKENTNFNIPDGAKVWIQPYGRDINYTANYEQFYTQGLSTGSIANQQEGWTYAALFEADKTWIYLSESGLDGTSPASHLMLPDSLAKNNYSLAYPDEKEALGEGDAHATFSSESWNSPWRVILIGNRLSDLVESDIITSLNSPSAITETGWIKPGLASWSWWAEPESPKNYQSLVKYIDFASEWQIPYFLVDANWNIMKGGTIEKLITYAKSKNVGIWLWYNSGGPHNTITEAPRDLMFTAESRKNELRRIHDLGVKGIKVDFFQSDKQHIIKHYLDILKDAGDNQLLVNFHGCTLPRGWNRTWPNLLSMESVRGAEYYIYDSLYPSETVWHNTVLPFTRNLSGPMDYTSMGLSSRTYKHLTSYGNELAQLIVFSSGVSHLIDRPENYDKQPAFIRDFIKIIPSAWDEIKLISGYPGKDIVMARRSGEKWYIAGMNGENKTKQLKVPLDFLGNGRNYHANLILDGKSENEFSQKETLLVCGEELTVVMLPNGGFVAVLE